MQIRNILILLALLLFSVGVYAGASTPVPVTIEFNEDGGGSASGDMISARNSDNEFELIGCGTRAVDLGGGSVYNWGFCQARIDEDGEEGFVNCIVEDNPALLAGIDSISDSSYITFGWNDDLTCNRVGTSTQSFYLEKGQKTK